MYSFFNGIYKKDGTHDGRPIYREVRKSSSKLEGHFETIKGAEIR